MYCTDKHPAKLRQGKDKAKLISMNDSNGFTYRGRFVSKKEAISVGYETSQKIHNALRWLIQKQAYKYDGQTILTWNAHCDDIMSALTSQSCLLPTLTETVDTVSYTHLFIIYHLYVSAFLPIIRDNVRKGKDRRCEILQNCNPAVS